MRRLSVLGPVALVLTLPGGALGDALAKPLRQSLPLSPGGTVVLENLAGKLDVVAAKGAEVVLTGTVHADGGGKGDSQALLDAVTVDVRNAGAVTTFHIVYPVEREPFRYLDETRTGSSWSSSSSTAEYQGRKVTVREGRGSDPLLYADLVLEVPKGIAVKLVNHVGRVAARGVEGSLAVKTSSGDVTAGDIGGAVSVKTGSGDVRMDGCQALEVSTGSGDVTATRAAGAVSIHTGSGDVELSKSGSGTVSVGTGSGDISLDGVAGSLELDTGSGDIRGRALAEVEKLKVGTGSGQVKLALDAPRGLAGSVHTASGDVELDFVSAPAMRLSVSTASGGIDVDRLPAARVTHRGERSLEAEVSGGGPELRIRTASGDVTIR